MSKSATQVTQLATYLGVYPYVTQLIARQVLGIERLASRIFDLKQAGYTVNKSFCKDFSGKRYVRYYLSK
ncbi:hypothetical protein KAR91_65495 [Candidatus Pacearchaeota archaeon]|nr:hypothetical protein [Candidatus Pacearchaeota archaeon]